MWIPTSTNQRKRQNYRYYRQNYDTQPFTEGYTIHTYNLFPFKFLQNTGNFLHENTGIEITAAPHQQKGDTGNNQNRKDRKIIQLN